MNKIIILFVAVLFFNNAFSQAKGKREKLPRRKPSFDLHIGGGFSYYTAPVNIRSIGLPGSITRTSPAGTVRLMWNPRYRLRLGIESGFTNFYSYKVKNGDKQGSVNLQAIPLLVVWSMRIVKGLDIFAGFGSYRLNTHLNYSGNINSGEWVLGSNVAIGYSFPLSRRLSLAAESKLMNAFETKDATLGLQAQLVWKMFQYD